MKGSDLIKMVDMFCGTKSMSNVFELRGHDVLTIDWDEQHDPDICDNVLNLSANDILGFCGWDSIDYIHMSPDCTTYSIAAISHHRNLDKSPKTEKAKLADDVRKHIINIIGELSPSYYTIENPVGLMRKMPELIKLAKLNYHATVSYCQYGDKRKKPTDIWHNIPTLQLKPPCKNGASCHESAPRGSKTGTQGLKGSVDRSKIPDQLCIDVCIAVENALKQ